MMLIYTISLRDTIEHRVIKCEFKVGSVGCIKCDY